MSDNSTPEPEQPTQPVEPAASPPPPAAYPSSAPAAPPAYEAPPAYGAAPTAYGATPPAYGAAPAYGAPSAYGAAPAYGAGYAPKTNTLAIVSLIASIAGFVIFYFIGSIVGIITGHMSLSQIKRSGEGGRGLALAGVIVGYVGLALAILGIIAFIAFWGLVAANVDQIPTS